MHLNDIHRDILEAQQHLSNLKSLYHQIESKQKTIDDKRHVVSDHAVLRYMERKLNVDIDGFKDQLCDGKTNTIRAMKSGTIKTGEGYQLVIQNGIVVTIL